MSKVFPDQLDKSAIYDIITNGLIEENRYYHCEIPEEYSDNDDSLIKALSCASWIDGADEPITKGEQRGISIIPRLNPAIDSDQAYLVGICDCCVARDTKTEVEIDTDFPEIEMNVGEIDLKMSGKEYVNFFRSYLNGGVDNITMPPLTVKCKTLPKVPKCDKCDGTGRVECDYCHGYGNGECPDCNGHGRLFPNGEFGQEHWFCNKIGYSRHDQRVISMDTCPTCKGAGEFKCDVCDGSGEKECEDCKGSGLKKNGKKAQKVTRLIEGYTISKRCFLSWSDDDVVDVDPAFICDALAKTPTILIDPQKDKSSKIIRSLNIGEANSYIKKELAEFIEHPNIFALNVAIEHVDKVSAIKFQFKNEEYSILVVGNMAFAERLPELSLFEKLFGKY